MNQSPRTEEEDQHTGVRVSGQNGYYEHGDRGDGWSNHRNELKEASQGTQNQGIRHAHDGEDNCVRYQRQAGQDDLGADVGPEHDVDVGEQAIDHGPVFRVGRKAGDTARHLLSLLEEEQREDRYQDQPPNVRGGGSNLSGQSLAVTKNLVPMGS